MIKSLQQALPLLTIEGLRSFLAKQTSYLIEVRRLISGATAEMARIDAEAKPFLTGGTRLVGNTPVRVNSPADATIARQVVDRKARVRVGLDSQLTVVFKKMLAAKAVAQEYAGRHWTKPQVLNRATTGAGATEGLTRRAAYAEIFEKVGKAQLFDFGQLAIDTGDAVLADAVYRAVMIRSRDERPFQPAEFISLVQNTEYTDSVTILQGILDTADEAGQAIATFEGKTGQVSLNRIALGLRGQGAEIANDDLLDEAGGVREDAMVRMGKQFSGQTK